MTSLTVHGGRPLVGTVQVPGDKSISHRALIMAGLAEGVSTITGLSDGDDVARTAAAMTALGTAIDTAEGFSNRVVVKGGTLTRPDRAIDVGNSGTAIRLLAGVCAGQAFESELFGDDSIAKRPMGRIADPLRLMGASIGGPDDGDFPPLRITGGGLVGIDYDLPVASAQVKGAVLLAGLFADGDTTVGETLPTRMHTEEMLAAFGAEIEVGTGSSTVRSSALHPLDFDVAADPSQAAFWIVAATLVPGSDVTVPNVYLGPARSGFLDVLLRMGADLDIDRDSGSVRARFTELRATEIAPAEIPGLIDEIPVLAVAAARAEGVSRFVGINELRHKETDRVATVSRGVAATGGVVEVDGDTMLVSSEPQASPGTVRADGDHRIAMAFAVAGLIDDGATTIAGFEAVRTSYPGFLAHLRELQGDDSTAEVDDV
jgi:3-phosphoshikimate 1-carboxyvinyltransferase